MRGFSINKKAKLALAFLLMEKYPGEAGLALYQPAGRQVCKGERNEDHERSE